MLSGRGLCDELITRPEESYRLWCVVVCDLERKYRVYGKECMAGTASHNVSHSANIVITVFK